MPLQVVRNGAETFTSNLIVPKGDPNAKTAWEFCNFVAQAKPQADFAMLLPYGPANPGARALMPEWAAAPDAGLAREREQPSDDAAWLGPRLASIRERRSQRLTT